MTRYDSTRQAWENIWDSASVEKELVAVRYPRSLETIRIYSAYLPKDDLILEAGSGLSAVVLLLREMGFRVAGMDYAENALHTSRACEPTLPLLCGDVHSLPFPDNALGGYLSFGVLEHFEHGMTPALTEAYRILKPGGVLVLTIPYPNIVQQLVAWRRRLRGASTLNNDDFYESTYTRAALIDAVRGAGFAVRRAEPTSHSFTLWGLGGVFRADGYYQTSALAENAGRLAKRVFPWLFNFMTLIVAVKPGEADAR